MVVCKMTGSVQRLFDPNQDYESVTLSTCWLCELNKKVLPCPRVKSYISVDQTVIKYKDIRLTYESMYNQ